MLPDRVTSRLVDFLSRHGEHASKSFPALLYLERCERDPAFASRYPAPRLDSAASSDLVADGATYSRTKKVIAWLGDQAEKCTSARVLMEHTIAKARPELAAELDGATSEWLADTFAALPDAPPTQPRTDAERFVRRDARRDSSMPTSHDPAKAQIADLTTLHRAHMTTEQRDRAVRLDTDRSVEPDPVAAFIRAERDRELSLSRTDGARDALREQHIRFDAQITDDRRFREELALQPVPRFDATDPEVAPLLAAHERFYAAPR